MRHAIPAMAAALTASALALFPISAAAEDIRADGKVEGLNETAFTAIDAMRKRNPGSFNAADGRDLSAAIMSDGTVDPAERDLLVEMTQSRFRSIAVTRAGAGPDDPKVSLYTTAGEARRILLATLNPPLDLDTAWARDLAGWRDIVGEYKKGQASEAGTLTFVNGKLAEKWKESSTANGFKPLRDLIGRLYGYSNAAAADTNEGHALIYRAMKDLDRSEQDRVPDFMYNWIKPPIVSDGVTPLSP